jgi:hypothetical protein
MKTKNIPYSEGMKMGFSAPSPQDFRTFSAGSPLIGSGKGAENVLRWCEKWGKYLLIVSKWLIGDRGVIKA